MVGGEVAQVVADDGAVRARHGGLAAGQVGEACLAQVQRRALVVPEERPFGETLVMNKGLARCGWKESAILIGLSSSFSKDTSLT